MEQQISSRSENRSKQWSVFALLGLLFVGFLLWYLWTPYQYDDLMFMSPFKGYKECGESFNWGNIFSMWSELWNYNNIRFGNLSTPLTLVLFPKWLTNFLTSALSIAMIVYCARLSKIKMSQYAQYFCLSFLIIAALPWWDRIAVADYAINYVWASAIGLVFLSEFLNGQKSPFLLLLPLCFISGGMHEGFTMPLLCGMIPYLLLNCKSINRRQWIMIAAFIIGFIVIMTSPGKLDRETAPTFDRRITIWAYVLLFHNPLLVPLALMIIWTIIKHGAGVFARILKSPTGIFVFAAFAGYIMAGYLYMSGRISWFGQLMAVIAIALLWNDYLLPQREYRLLSKIITMIIGIFLLVHFIIVDYYAYKVYNQHNEILKEYKKAPSQNIYYDYLGNNDIPIFALGKVQANAWFDEFPLNCMRLYYKTDVNDKFDYDDFVNNYPILNMPKVVPKMLHDVRLSDAAKVSGDNPFYLVRDRYFVARKGDLVTGDSFNTQYERIISPTYRFLVIPFTTRAGEELLYCKVADGYYIQHHFDRLIRMDKQRK